MTISEYLYRERGLKLHDLALSVVREKGTPIPAGSIPIMEYRRGLLSVRYWPQQGRLEVWHGRKVLRVERWGSKRQLIRYEPGSWEGDLMEAAKVAA
jgi:hypothetical protein